MDFVEYSSSINNQQIEQKLPPLTNNGQTREIGVRYTIATSLVAHNLPPKNALRNDQHSGVIDSWPAHSANQRPSNIQMSLAKDKTLMISNAQAEGKPDLTPKPKFLDNLDKFLQRELKKLGSTNYAIANDARLQAYREAFEYLLEEFKTYKPILTSIKNEYELMLVSQREKIRELEPLKQMLVTLADQCDHKLMQYREEEKMEIMQLKEERKKLSDMVAHLKNDRVALQTQVDKLQNELLIEHDKFRAEHDKRKLLILDVNDLRFQQEEAKLAEIKREKKRNATAVGQQEDESKDDPVTLKIALKVCRQNLNDAMKRLTKMEADYNDVVPRRDYEHLDSKYKDSLIVNENLEKELNKMRHDQLTIKEYTNKLEEKYREMQQEIEEINEVNTPRPDWDKVEKVVESEKWKEMSANKSSSQLLDVLIHDLTASNKKEFIGLGNGTDVPVYLRFEGRPKNRNFSLREISNIISDILKERIEQIENKDKKDEIEEFPEFFISYLKKKYTTDAFDYSYSLNDGFAKYSQENIKYFHDLLTGDSDENIILFESRIVNQFNEQLKTNDPKFTSKNMLKEILKNYFKFKEIDQIEMLIRIAEDDASATEPTKLEYQLLFDEMDENKQFLSVFKSFIREERLNLASKIKDNIGNNNAITSSDLKKAIAATDETISEKNTEKILYWVYNFQFDKTIDHEMLRKRIENCCLYNYPKK